MWWAHVLRYRVLNLVAILDGGCLVGRMLWPLEYRVLVFDPGLLNVARDREVYKTHVVVPIERDATE